MKRLSFLFPLLAAGCLEPLVPDEPGASVHILPPGTSVPHVSADGDLVRQFAANDGLDDSLLEETGGVVPLRSGWAGGAPVRYWDFGQTPQVTAMLYALVRRTPSGEVEPVPGHPYLLDSIPGDAGYSPYWAVNLVEVTGAYGGERLVSKQALADAVDLGLVLEPEPAGVYVNCPVVPPGTRLEVGGGAEPWPSAEVYARGYRVEVLALGGADAMQPLRFGTRVPSGDVFVVWEGRSLSPRPEPVFQNGPPASEEQPWTPLVRVVEVRVKEDPGNVAPEVRDEGDLFVRGQGGQLQATTEIVEYYELTEVWKNLPIQRVEASP